MQLQEIPMFQVMGRTQKTEEGQGQQDKEEFVPPLQEVPSQEAPSSWTGQVHVEQKKYKDCHFKSICDTLEVAFKPRNKFSTELGRYMSKGNELGDNWWCTGTPGEGENKYDKWITLTGR